MSKSDPVRKIVMCIFALLLIPFHSVASFPFDPPSRAQVQSMLDMLNVRQTLSAEEQLSRQDLLNTLTYLDQIEEIKQSIHSLNQQLADAPDAIKRASRNLQVLRQAENSEKVITISSTKELNRVESQVNEIQSNIQIAQDKLSTYSSQLTNLQTLPERLQSTMYATTQRIWHLSNQLKGIVANNDILRNTQRNMLNAEWALSQLRLEFQRKQLDANTTLQDALQQQSDYQVAYIAQQEKQLQGLQAAINHTRLSYSEQANRDANRVGVTAEIMQSHPLIEQIMADNHQLRKQLVQQTENINTLIQQNSNVKNLLEQTQQAERNIREQITLLKGTILLSRILYQQQQNLPNNQTIAEVNSRIADIRLEQFDVNQQRELLFQGGTPLNKLGAKGEMPHDPKVLTILTGLVDIRRDLLDRLNQYLGEELSLAINLQINQEQLLNIHSVLQKTLKQQIFWVNSNKPINLAWIKNIPSTIKTELNELRYDSASFHFTKGLWNSLWLLVPISIVILLLLRSRTRLNQTINQLTQELGKLTLDSQYHTPVTILLTMLKILPVSLFIFGTGYALSQMETTWSKGILDISIRIAISWLAISLLYQLLSPNGVYEKHFLFVRNHTSYYRKKVILLGLAIVPLIIWSVLGEYYPLFLADDAIGQIIILLTLGIIVTLSWPVCHTMWKSRDSYSARLIFIVLISFMPIVMLVLMLAGYFYTTLKLAGNWIETLYLLLLWHLVYFSLVRGLRVAAQRLEYRRIYAQNIEIEDMEGSKLIQEVPLGVEQINQQTLRFTSMALFLLFMFFFLGIWSDIFTVFSYLNNVSLWHYNVNTAAGVLVKSVTLGSLLLALLVLIVTYMVVRNLPGLLEVFVLSRLQLSQGTAYAFTTMLTYLLVAISLLIILGILGVSWDKLQWLVAALSLGLGFGLQEIVANFVSGVIILFERPIRIGDTITLQNDTGVVSKIRIRATTLRAFDKKEIIVPNKAFVTERLVNWTLSDTITRVIIKVGVVYGSDLNKLKSLLLQVAKENPLVMSDPEPQVFFIEFADNNLRYELRFCVRELKDRSYAVDELSYRIAQLCRENQIVLYPSPQLDVYLHKGR